jgi:hypothetical protein
MMVLKEFFLHLSFQTNKTDRHDITEILLNVALIYEKYEKV